VTEPANAESAPETKRIRLTDEPIACLAPQFLAEEFLRQEGFSDVQYVKVGDGIPLTFVAAGKVDLVLEAPGSILTRVEAGDPLTILAGLHVGCWELFGTERVQTIRDLHGKRVAVLALGAANHVFLSAMLAYVGIDPRRDVKWVTHEPDRAIQLLAEGKVDAYLAFPPEPQELRAKKIGHVVVNTAKDKPWSQYFCCMAVANRNFVRQYPIATKRALRALLKAADLCAQDPARAARYIVDKGYTPSYEYALATLRDLAYNRWRTDNPENTLRFHALRLHDIGMIKTNPNTLIAKVADWRPLRELKKALKA